MSFTTRCPACGTTFRIVPDQLKISDGWVRCGHCADVFDATLFLEGEVSVMGALAPVPPPGDGAAIPPDELPPPVSAPVAEQAEVADAPGPVQGFAEAEDDEGWLLPPPVAVAEAPLDESFADELRSFAQSAQSVSVSEPAVVVQTVAPAALPEPFAPDVLAAESVGDRHPVEAGKSPASAARPIEPLVSDEAALAVEPGFVRQAKRRAFWHSRGVRTGLHLASLLLALALLAQVAVHQRDTLAARFPAASPVLAALCQPLGCELEPVRRIESVVIDSSNLVRRLGNFYSFDLVLKNSAQTAVAVPALELSLTDTRDAVIVRRVFLPDDLPGAPTLLPPQGNLSLSLRLSIADLGVSSMSGYRALVFYP